VVDSAATDGAKGREETWRAIKKGSADIEEYLVHGEEVLRRTQVTGEKFGPEGRLRSVSEAVIQESESEDKGGRRQRGAHDERFNWRGGENLKGE